jgi:hypothetical protein
MMVKKKYNTKNVVKIQSWFRGHIFRRKRLPLTMYIIQNYLLSASVSFTTTNLDGRINSCFDEETVIKCLLLKFKKRVKIPKIRMWYDLLIFDRQYGWIPVNIKTTTTRTHDNTGNLAMCVWALTNEKLELSLKKSYENGKMSQVLIEKLHRREYNHSHKKDYYFLVLNKTCNSDIIINSIKGLTTMTSNINNLPFQICWDKNRNYQYKTTRETIQLFVDCIQKANTGWKETFTSNIRKINTKML